MFFERSIFGQMFGFITAKVSRKKIGHEECFRRHQAITKYTSSMENGLASWLPLHITDPIRPSLGPHITLVIFYPVFDVLAYDKGFSTSSFMFSNRISQD
ncbi:unnamed protein product [Bursaphelenchus xylophilus]|uniref:(pine wood nematode) hypothetical protein n=1 Tax=Bursaphelenchus xylophilus TaxID=6326 RepID=A0A7I8WLG6_BURXY|nr:unnamed protein product [Bursaphelenchus xylophilus]CAG9105634.1 unnamed protein product [Bursaphelenchus xylophilus]